MSIAKGEWARHWPLPFIALLGSTGPAAYSFASGVFMEPMTRELGWSRTEFTFSFMLQTIIGLVVMPIVGRMVDRFGPRRMALWGIAPFVLAFSLLATTGSSIGHWWFLVSLLAVFTGGVAPTIWVTGVVRSFQESRGIALAISLAGIGLATAIWPVLAARYIELLGWRLAFPAIAASWAVVMIPLTILLFKPAVLPSQEGAGAERKPLPIGPILRSPVFIALVASGGLFAAVQLAIITQFVPIAAAQGLSLTQAAGIAGIIGVASVIGRVGTGFLLDRLPTRVLAVFAFSLIVPVALLLMTADGSVPMLMAAAVIMGLAGGAEIDVLTYSVSRRFDPRLFASAYSVLHAGLSICASLGPLGAGKLFDLTGGYDLFLRVAIPLDLLAVAMIALALTERRVASDAS